METYEYTTCTESNKIVEKIFQDGLKFESEVLLEIEKIRKTKTGLWGKIKKLDANMTYYYIKEQERKKINEKIRKFQNSTISSSGAFYPENIILLNELVKDLDRKATEWFELCRDYKNDISNSRIVAANIFLSVSALIVAFCSLIVSLFN